MSNRLFAATALSAAMGLALAMQGTPASAQGMDMSKASPMMKETMQKMKKNHLEQCYGINAVAKNDCGGGAHSCSGQATQARDPKSFVLVPAGVCSKIAGGSVKPA
ncbi:BufA1 family periplasmic bufferin-type metallophore [Paraburkholderia fungorum]|uniref:Membrane protein n=1 Tax=Paraburkholderia fungorum TaxID=134537 RepID=A0AAW3V157_9BURK|nr:DUF2282 domain-containing protein [Paraburkholderia fungorum]MBB4517500.1 putative membrane protein [Paraburkholderia fungorum]MBB6204568.1 putative membrane protein [Paraburkholderia fungorum]